MLLMTLALGAESLTHLAYDLAVEGKVVGSREVTVRFYPRAGGERRVIESYTTVTVVGQAIEARSSGQSNPRGATFSTAASVGGGVIQVQGVQEPDGDWRVTWRGAEGGKEQTVTASPIVLTTLDLLDPGRTAFLQQPGNVALVFAETGDVVSGTLGSGVATTASVGGKTIPVTRYEFTTPGGKGQFSVDGEGWLVASDVRWFGVSVAAKLREVPAPRDFGAVETVDVLGVEIGADQP